MGRFYAMKPVKPVHIARVCVGMRVVDGMQGLMVVSRGMV
jgi:hypothetical protein